MSMENKYVGWLYKDKLIAEKCEDWCTKHKTCSLDLQRHAIKIK